MNKGVPSAEAWQSFGDVGMVIIFLCALATAVGGVLWKFGSVRRRHPSVPTAAPTPGAGTEVTQAIVEVQRTQGMVASLGERVSEIEADRANVTEIRRRLDVDESDLKTLRLHVAENYISREDWVPMTSRVISMLENHTAMLARLDERSQRRMGD